MQFFGAKRIYLDYASAPPVSDAAIAAMKEAYQWIGNPGAIHKEAVEAKAALDRARALMAKLLGVKARELIFTAGLTDANNLAILGFARAYERRARSLKDTHWIVSSIEHASVLESFAEVERLGGTVEYVDPDEKGIVSPERIAAALKKHSVFVSVGWANNEIGTIQPLSDIAQAIRAHEKKEGTTVLLHADAGQALVYEPTVVESLGVDLLSIGGNKLYGPHGIGALYVSNRADLASFSLGGPQERGLRPGTESVALVRGMAAAFASIVEKRKEEARRVRLMRDELRKSLEAAIPGLVVNGDLRRALPHMLNVSIPHIQSEYVTLALDHAGIAVSTKSACKEGEARQSHVVAALGGETWRAENTLRFSLGEGTTAEDIPKVSAALATIINKGSAKAG